MLPFDILMAQFDGLKSEPGLADLYKVLSDWLVQPYVREGGDGYRRFFEPRRKSIKVVSASAGRVEINVLVKLHDERDKTDQ